MMPRRKGIVGIEAAIVLIAFVIVAAALAFVALNMGLFTTQKSKEVMQRGLEEATSALEIDGSVIGEVDAATGGVDLVAVPLKISPGREGVDMDASKVNVRVILPGGFYEDAYCGVVDGSTLADTSLSTIQGANPCTAPEFAYLVIFNGDGDNVLEFGEKGLLVLDLSTPGVALSSYDEFRVEIRTVQGASLTVERMVPATLPASGAVSLG